ncbi:MAG: hypothetical protein EKK57_10440 [Proteobacteria bacterium]|nr:MAG: hypothetical protein EKK57_10440 [Pseudomonadota bacterium]
MHKLKLLLLIAMSSTAVFAAPVEESATVALDNQAFQKFDDQFYLGWGATYGNLTNAYGENANYGMTTIGFGVERLFDMGLWMRFDGTMMIGYSNFNSSNPNAITAPLGQNPSIANLDMKIGYAFPVVKDTLLVTPYGLVGRNTNLSSNSLNNNMSTGSDGTTTPTINTTEDYFLTGGIGGRIEYIPADWVELYFDQNALYSSDQSQPTSTYSSMSNFSFTSTLGAKFNVWQELQLGASAYYTRYALVNSATYAQQYQLNPQNDIGFMATIGLTY